MKAILQTKNLSGILRRLLLEKRKFISFPEGEVEVCEACEVHMVVHVAVEVVVHQLCCSLQF
jgi:hypothetical protein